MLRPRTGRSRLATDLKFPSVSRHARLLFSSTQRRQYSALSTLVASARQTFVALLLAPRVLRFLTARRGAAFIATSATSLTLNAAMMHRLSLLLTSAAALVPHRTTQRLQPLSNDVIDVSESAVVEKLENAPYPSLVEKVELFLEKPLAGENQYLVKGRYEAPGAAVLYCFDEIRAQAKDNQLALAPTFATGT